MSRLRSLLSVAILTLFCGGCFLVARDVHSVQGPPEDSPAKAARWWDDYVVKEQDLAFLTLLLDASDVHRQNGSVATYRNYWIGVAMFGRQHRESHFTLPMPENAAITLRERLRSSSPVRADRDVSRGFWVNGAAGCTNEEAQAIWRNAARKVMAKDEPSAPAVEQVSPAATKP